MHAGLMAALFGSAARPYRGASLVLDFAGSSRTRRRPYYELNGRRYAKVSDIPGWTYTGGTPAGTGSYAPKADGSLQFFPSVTNSRIQTRAVENAAWVKRGTGAATASAIPAHDGSTGGSLLSGIGALGVNDIYQLTQLVFPTSTSFTPSLWINRVSTSGVISLKNAEDATKGEWRIDLATLGSGWQYITRTHPAVTIVTEYTTTSGGLNGLHFTAFSGAPLSFYVDKIQTELGSTASTYIPTTTAAVTVATPRITDGVGYWAEEARTNLLLRSQEFDNASWTKSNVSVTANQAAAPDGTVTADLVIPDVTSTQHQIYQSVTHTAASTTTSIYVKPAGYDRIAIREASTTGGYVVASLTGSGSILTSSVLTGSVTALANGWYRVSATWTAAAASQVMMFYVVGPGYTSGSPSAYSWSGDGTSGVYFWNAQDELGSFATSPIPTTSVAVTRAADVGYVSGLVFPVPSTVVGTFSIPTVVNTAYQTIIGGATGLPNLAIGNGASPVLSSSIRNVVGTGSTVNAYTSNTAATAAMRAKTGENAIALSGGAIAANSSTFTGATSGNVGMGYDIVGTNNWLNGPVRRIVIYPRAMSNAELQAITLPTAA